MDEQAYRDYLRRNEESERLLRARERELGVKSGPTVSIEALREGRESGEGAGKVSFVPGEPLRLVCLRALTALPLAIEDVVRGVSSAAFFDYGEDEVREEVVELLARYNYATEFDFLGNEPPRHRLPRGLLDAELALRSPESSRRRRSALAV